MNIPKFILFVLLFFFSLMLSAQEVKNIRVLQQNNNVSVRFDLLGQAENFKVDLFYSTNNGETWQGPLKGVTGAVGIDIKPGKDKRIIWNVLSEPELEEGYMQFKVVAESVIPPSKEILKKQENNLASLDLRKYKTGKTISLILGIASAGTGVYSYLQGNKLYDQYQIATDDAADLRSRVETHDIVYPIAFALAGASTVSFIIYSAKHSKVRKSLSLQPVPLKGGGGLALSIHF